VQFDALTRPLQLPLLQTTAGTLQKVSFDFIVARRGDGVGATIDDELATLQNFAAEDNSVIFVGVHQMMATSVTAWKIQSMSVQVTRVNETGQSVSAQVNMSCTEATDQLERFLTLPKFTYKNPRGTGKGNDDKPPGDNASLLIYNFWLRLTVDAKDDLNEKGKENTLREGLNRLATQYGGESNVLDILVKATRGQYGADKLFNLLETALKNNPTTSVRAGSGK